MIDLKTEEEIGIMHEGGQILGNILRELIAKASAGDNLLDIEKHAVTMIQEAGCLPSFPTVEGYTWATCLCVNDAIVHGIPKDRLLLEGDILTIDVGLIHKGFHADTAWTKIIQSEEGKGEKEKFLRVGEETLWKAIEQVKPGNHIGDISRVIQQNIEGAGYSIIKSLVGHGVGKNLHEDPQIPGYLTSSIEDTMILSPGMTLAIEVIYAMGSGKTRYDENDGWTIRTRDRSVSAVFEHSVGIGEKGTLVLTGV